MKYALTIAASMLLCGCMKTVDYVLPQSPLPAERKPLTVPHRDWIEQGCYPKIVNGKDVKVCK
jgi:hypothetical protein